LLRLDDIRKPIVVVSVVLVMKFIHSHGVIRLDLKRERSMLDEGDDPEIGDL
jgi:serine/threonine protein kinase